MPNITQVMAEINGYLQEQHKSEDDADVVLWVVAAYVQSVEAKNRVPRDIGNDFRQFVSGMNNDPELEGTSLSNNDEVFLKGGIAGIVSRWDVAAHLRAQRGAPPPLPPRPTEHALAEAGEDGSGLDSFEGEVGELGEFSEEELGSDDLGEASTLYGRHGAPGASSHSNPLHGSVSMKEVGAAEEPLGFSRPGATRGARGGRPGASFHANPSQSHPRQGGGRRGASGGHQDDAVGEAITQRDNYIESLQGEIGRLGSQYRQLHQQLQQANQQLQNANQQLQQQAETPESVKAAAVVRALRTDANLGATVLAEEAAKKAAESVEETAKKQADKDKAAEVTKHNKVKDLLAEVRSLREEHRKTAKEEAERLRDITDPDRHAEELKIEKDRKNDALAERSSSTKYAFGSLLVTAAIICLAIAFPPAGAAGIVAAVLFPLATAAATAIFATKAITANNTIDHTNKDMKNIEMGLRGERQISTERTGLIGQRYEALEKYVLAQASDVSASVDPTAGTSLTAQESAALNVTLRDITAQEKDLAKRSKSLLVSPYDKISSATKVNEIATAR